MRTYEFHVTITGFFTSYKLFAMIMLYHYAKMPPNRIVLLNLRQQIEEEEERAVILVDFIRRRQNENRRRRRWWVRPWIQRRSILGHYSTLMDELERESEGDFVSYMRMEPAMFHEILLRISPRISKLQRYVCLSIHVTSFLMFIFYIFLYF